MVIRHFAAIFQYLLIGLRLVLFNHQQNVPLLGKYLLHDLRLCPHRVCRDGASLYIQQFQ